MWLITKYGYDVVTVVTLIVLIGAVASWSLVEWKAARYILLALLVAFELVTLNFFRDPDRVTPVGDGLVVAPADGKVIAIKETVEEEFIQGEAVQVSIFMSPLDVHVNRYPVSGQVAYFKHFPGEYLAAFDDKASLRNEQTHIGIRHGERRVLFKQIAGMLARRIVAQVTIGDEAVTGRRFGMIKFGSRVDVLVPKGSDVKVKLGERAVAGQTVVAVLS